MVHKNDLAQAVSKLTEALSWEKSEVNRDAAILRFELSAELAWKSMRDNLKEQGIIVNSPVHAVREAFRTGLIEYEDMWVDLVRDRNVIAHTYNENRAEDLYAKLPEYVKLLNKLLKNLA